MSRTPERLLYPLGGIPDDAFVSNPYEISENPRQDFGSDSEYEAFFDRYRPTGAALEVTKLCLGDVYHQYLEWQDSYPASRRLNFGTLRICGRVAVKPQRGSFMTRADYNGPDIRIIEQTRRMPVHGDPNEHNVYFTTVYQRGEEDRALWANAMSFNIESDLDELDNPYPAKLERGNVVFGRRDGVLSVIGEYRDLFAQNNPNIAKHVEREGGWGINLSLLSVIKKYKALSAQTNHNIAKHVEREGWKDIGEIRLVDMERYSSQFDDSQVTN